MMNKPTKHEKKMLKAAKKLENYTKKYMKQLTKLDETFQELPTKVSRCYELEKDYFSQVPRIATASMQLELLYSRLYSSLYNNGEMDPDTTYWEDLRE